VCAQPNKIGSESLLSARDDALDYIETNPDEHESRLLAALVTDLAVLEAERDEARDELKRVVKDSGLVITRVRQRAADAETEKIERGTAVIQLRAALTQIAETARWYADNGQRDPHEVDHALCVEILSMAERALDA